MTIDRTIVGTESVVEAGARNVDASLQRALSVGDDIFSSNLQENKLGKVH